MLKRFIFWEYQRGSWQYDVIVGVILVFLFLTPSGWFRDQPRVSHVSAISSSEFLVDPGFWDSTPEDQRMVRLTKEIRSKAGNVHLVVTSVQPVTDSEGELRYYVAITHP